MSMISSCFAFYFSQRINKLTISSAAEVKGFSTNDPLIRDRKDFIGRSLLTKTQAGNTQTGFPKISKKERDKVFFYVKQFSDIYKEERKKQKHKCVSEEQRIAL